MAHEMKPGWLTRLWRRMRPRIERQHPVEAHPTPPQRAGWHVDASGAPVPDDEETLLRPATALFGGDLRQHPDIAAWPLGEAKGQPTADYWPWNATIR